jgi:UPF0755 protein
MLAGPPTVRGRGRLVARLVAFVVLMLAVAVAVYQAGRPPRPGTRRSHFVVVPPGTGVTGVARLLRRRGMIRSALYFEALSLVTGQSRDLEAGTYSLSPGMAPGKVLHLLASGDVAAARVTVVPGMTVAEVARVVATSGLVSAAAFLGYVKTAKPPAGFAPTGQVREPLEGYLYPDTYRLALGSSPAQVVAPMLAAFERAFGPSEKAAARAEGLTPAQAVTLASIVEREAATGSLRREVAGVFMNRLHGHMPLGSDATVYYAAQVPPGQHLTAAELSSQSPYNTLRHTGLPPGPIDSPGGGALAAALHPAHVPYLYFYARPDGRYVFSRTYAGQLAAEESAKAG